MKKTIFYAKMHSAFFIIVLLGISVFNPLQTSSQSTNMENPRRFSPGVCGYWEDGVMHIGSRCISPDENGPCFIITECIIEQS